MSKFNPKKRKRNKRIGLTSDANMDPPIQLLNRLSALTVDEINFTFEFYKQQDDNRTLNIELHETSVEEKYGMSGLTCAFRLRSRLSRSTKPFNKVLPPTAMTLLYKLCRMSMSHIPALDDTT